MGPQDMAKCRLFQCTKFPSTALCYINSRHQSVKHQIKALLEQKVSDCYEEVFAVDSTGTRRFSDIIAFPKDDSLALIVDPTIRYENNAEDQSAKVQNEKIQLYSSCEDFYNTKFKNKYG